MRSKLAILILGLLASACDRDVLANVGGTKIRRTDLETFRAGRSKAGGAEAALNALALRAALAEAGQKAGADRDPVVRARLEAARREILAQAYLDQALGDVASDEALRKQYAERKESLARRYVRVAHIMRGAPAEGERRKQAESEATRAYARLMAGEPFGQVAREMSDDTATLGRGGDLGILREGEVDATFFEQAAALKKGQLSRPFATALGFHVLLALEDPGKRIPTYEEARAGLAADVRRVAEAGLMDRVRKEVRIRLYPDRLSRGGQENQAK